MIEADDETLPYAEEDWQDPEHMEVPRNLEPDLPFTIQTRQNDGTRPKKRFIPYGDDFVVDRIDIRLQVLRDTCYPSRDFSPNLKQDLSGLSGFFRQLRSKSCFKMSGLSDF